MPIEMTFASSRRVLPVIVSALTLITSCSVSSGASTLTRTQRWDELRATITNQFVSLTLPDRTRLRGVVREVRANSLVLDVRRSSNRRLYPKERTEVPRALVTTIEMSLRRQPDRNRGAAIGAGVGVLVMSPVVLAIGDANIAPGWVAVVAIVVGGVAGAILGHHIFDRDDDPSHVRITVVPVSAAP